MTPQDFIAKWRHVELKERSASQSHFNDLCALLGLPDPVSADKTGEWFAFEKGASKTAGGEGWADVWRSGAFAWEYKGKRKNLDEALKQLLLYAAALENPPLLIVSDMDRIRIHTNWTNTVQVTHEIALDDLLDATKRDLLRHAFTDPDRLRPTKTRAALTEEAAERFATLALRLRARGHEAQAVAHFVNRLVFCLFAEDVGLLPNRIFQRMLEGCQAQPAAFEEDAQALFAAMRTGGKVGFERVEWFNGGLFDHSPSLPLDATDLKDVLAAARLDWSAIDPSILGTLFERGLDPAKRSQLGAHYTGREMIGRIVEPVVVAPLLAEWAEARARMAEALAREKAAKAPVTRNKAHGEAVAAKVRFLERLRAFRVLDPACGSGNFLYLALRALKDLEHRVNIEAEALGLPRDLIPLVGPENVLGIEVNAYAAELARVSVWIGDIQWMRANGYEVSRDPILRPLATIETRDALLDEDGAPAHWPDADAVVGNPPFLGGKRLRATLGDEAVGRLFAAYAGEVRPEADLVLYWFAKAGAMIREGRLEGAGFVATNSIRGGANRATLERAVGVGRIFDAWEDEPWVLDGAAVRVSMVSFDAGAPGGGPVRHDGKEVEAVHSDLTPRRMGALHVDLTRASKLFSNRNCASNGISKKGSFDVPGHLARSWLTFAGNPNGCSNSDVLAPWMNGLHVTRRSGDMWIIDFGNLGKSEAAEYEAPFEYARQNVLPERSKSRATSEREKWWRLARSAGAMRARLTGLTRFIATPEVSKYRVFVFLPAGIIPDKNLVVVTRDDDATFGILHSRFHELWALRMGTSLEDRPRYTPSTFETFPFPEGLAPDRPAADIASDPGVQAIAKAAADLNAKREAWLNPLNLVERVPEVVPDFPDRLLPKGEDAARTLKTRTLTALYNARPTWLADAHAALDAAVADAYGWGDDWRAGRLGDDEVLARLFRLNQERALIAAT